MCAGSKLLYRTPGENMDSSIAVLILFVACKAFGSLKYATPGDCSDLGLCLVMVRHLDQRVKQLEASSKEKEEVCFSLHFFQV